MKAFVFFATLLIAGAASAACKEGSKGWVTRQNSEGKVRSEARICQNGTYMTPAEKAAYIYNPRTACTEGSTGWVTRQNSEGKVLSEARICKNGTYMTAAEAAAYIRNPKTTCAEGTYGSARASDYFRNLSSNDADKSITVVCRSNKWVPVRGL